MTTEMLGKIEEMNKQGLNDGIIAEQLHCSQSRVREWRIRLGLPAVRSHRSQNLKLYDLYDGETTQFLLEGTAKECAEYMGVDIKTFHQAKSKFRRGIYKKHEIYEVEE